MLLLSLEIKVNLLKLNFKIENNTSLNFSSAFFLRAVRPLMESNFSLLLVTLT